jgi:hypothetical protein
MLFCLTCGRERRIFRPGRNYLVYGPFRRAAKIDTALLAVLNVAYRAIIRLTWIYMDHDIPFLAYGRKKGIGDLLFHCMDLGKGPVMREQDVQVNMVVSSRSQGPQLVRIQPAWLPDAIQALDYFFKKFRICFIHEVSEGFDD